MYLAPLSLFVDDRIKQWKRFCLCMTKYPKWCTATVSESRLLKLLHLKHAHAFLDELRYFGRLYEQVRLQTEQLMNDLIGAEDRKPIQANEENKVTKKMELLRLYRSLTQVWIDMDIPRFYLLTQDGQRLMDVESTARMIDIVHLACRCHEAFAAVSGMHEVLDAYEIDRKISSITNSTSLSRLDDDGDDPFERL